MSEEQFFVSGRLLKRKVEGDKDPICSSNISKCEYKTQHESLLAFDYKTHHESTLVRIYITWNNDLCGAYILLPLLFSIVLALNMKSL